MSTFGDRHGHTEGRVPVRYRNEAPVVLREALLPLAENVGGQGIVIAEMIRKMLPATYPTSHMPIKAVAQDALKDCSWYKVYDAAEAIRAELRNHGGDRGKVAAMKFERELNELFWREGIGWQMDGGRIFARVDDAGETAVHDAQKSLKAAGLATSAAELAKAREDISRRPVPDITGAIQHLGAAMECCMRDVCDDPRSTLGELLKHHRERFPSALLPALNAIWGYTSEMGRHLREGREPGMAEAVFSLEMTAAAINYLLSTRERG